MEKTNSIGGGETSFTRTLLANGSNHISLSSGGIQQSTLIGYVGMSKDSCMHHSTQSLTRRTFGEEPTREFSSNRRARYMYTCSLFPSPPLSRVNYQNKYNRKFGNQNRTRAEHHESLLSTCPKKKSPFFKLLPHIPVLCFLPA